MQNVLESTKFVIEHSKHVSINHEAITTLARSFDSLTSNHWLSEAPFDISDLNNEELIRLIFLFNCLSFSYWGNPKWTITHDSKQFDGAWGMIAALYRARNDGFPILNFDFCSSINQDVFAKILRGNVEIPLFEERLSISRSVGSTMVQKYNGGIRELVDSAKGSASEFLRILLSEFTSFSDSAEYQGKTIFFIKRAQLLVADVCHILREKENQIFSDIETLTACADYKLPQLLRHFDVLQYSSSLSEKVDQSVELLAGSIEEIEIRANTIWAIEFLRKELINFGRKLTAIEVNDIVWLASQDKGLGMCPYHRVRTTAY